MADFWRGGFYGCFIRLKKPLTIAFSAQPGLRWEVVIS
jgi:hypothetical protein